MILWAIKRPVPLSVTGWVLHPHTSTGHMRALRLLEWFGFLLSLSLFLICPPRIHI